MSKVNTRGNRSSQSGHKITRRGIAKKKKGIGLNITGKARRHWKSNMQRKKISFSDGTVRTMWVRVRDLRSGMYDNPNPKDFSKGDK
jgi:ribosomal protein L28